jgi:hypothetical protein
VGEVSSDKTLAIVTVDYNAVIYVNVNASLPYETLGFLKKKLNFVSGCSNSRNWWFSFEKFKFERSTSWERSERFEMHH